MNLFKMLAAFLVFCFTVTLLWCGDAECLKGNSTDDCASLVCSLLNKHNPSDLNSTNRSLDDCSCVCHVPTVTTSQVDFLLRLSFQTVTSTETSRIFSTPNRLIYRPPTPLSFFSSFFNFPS